MGIILNMDSVGDYNSFLGQETLHPLVSVVVFPGSRRCGMSARLTGSMPFSKDRNAETCGTEGIIMITRRELLSSYLPARCWAMMTTGNISG